MLAETAVKPVVADVYLFFGELLGVLVRVCYHLTFGIKLREKLHKSQFVGQAAKPDCAFTVYFKSNVAYIKKNFYRVFTKWK